MALEVSLLIALMKNQVDAIRGNHEDSSIAQFLNSSLNKSEAEKVVKDVTSVKRSFYMLRLRLNEAK